MEQLQLGGKKKKKTKNIWFGFMVASPHPHVILFIINGSDQRLHTHEIHYNIGTQNKITVS